MPPTVCGVSVPRPGIEPMLPTLEAWRLNHWMASEVPVIFLFDLKQKVRNSTRDSFIYKLFLNCKAFFHSYSNEKSCVFISKVGFGSVLFVIPCLLFSMSRCGLSIWKCWMRSRGNACVRTLRAIWKTHSFLSRRKRWVILCKPNSDTCWQDGRVQLWEKDLQKKCHFYFTWVKQT